MAPAWAEREPEVGVFALRPEDIPELLGLLKKPQDGAEVEDEE